MTMHIDDETRLFRAALRGDVAEVAALYKAGVDINARDSSGATALFHAGVLGRESVIEFLLPRVEDVNARMARKMTPLLMAVNASNFRGVKAILRSEKVDVNACDDMGRSALDYAEAFGGMDDIIEALKDKGAINGPYHSKEPAGKVSARLI